MVTTEKKTAWFTRTQIGSALEYEYPVEAIGKIHNRHKERLDQFSRVTQIDLPSGRQDVYIYSIRGVFEICRWSKQPKANMVMDALYDMAEKVVQQGYYSTMSDDQLVNHICDKYRNNPDFLKKITPARIQRRIEDQDFTKQYLIDLDAQVKCEELYKQFGRLTDEEFVSELKNICKDASPQILATELKYYQKYLSRCIAQARH